MDPVLLALGQMKERLDLGMDLELVNFFNVLSHSAEFAVETNAYNVMNNIIWMKMKIVLIVYHLY